MQIVRTLLIAAIASAQTSTLSDPVLVTSVSQGDAVQVATVGRVRLLGITAPRATRSVLAGEPFGREAVERLGGLVAHRWVRLEFPRRAHVGSTSHAAYVLLEDGTFVNAVLAREGLVRVTVRGSSAREQQLLDAQTSAQALRRGIWGR